MLLGERPLVGLADVAARAGDLVRIGAHIAVRYGFDHPLLTIFVVAAAVLVAAVSWL